MWKCYIFWKFKDFFVWVFVCLFVYLSVLCISLPAKLLFCYLSHRQFSERSNILVYHNTLVYAAHISKIYIYSNIFRSEIFILALKHMFKHSIYWQLYFERFECLRVIPNSVNSWDCSELFKLGCFYRMCVSAYDVHIKYTCTDVHFSYHSWLAHCRPQWLNDAFLICYFHLVGRTRMR